MTGGQEALVIMFVAGVILVAFVGVVDAVKEVRVAKHTGQPYVDHAAVAQADAEARQSEALYQSTPVFSQPFREPRSAVRPPSKPPDGP